MIRIWPVPVHVSGTLARRSAVIERPDGRRDALWFQTRSELAPWIDETRADALLLACLFAAMRAGQDVRVHGAVSRSLLRNLSEFVRVFAAWRPRAYTAIDLAADEEPDDAGGDGRAGAVTGFSGGVDGSFTVWRHATGRAGRWSRPLAGVVFAHGFDIPLEQVDVYERVCRRARAWIEAVSGGTIEILPVATNLRALGPDWTDACGAGLAAALSLFGGRAREGLIAGETTYAHLVLPDGVNPITDHLLGSDRFPIIHDGAAFERPDKLRALADAPGGLAHLRVCWEGAALDGNCGRCEKCVRTLLAARVAGLSRPACFARDASDDDIRAVWRKLARRHPLDQRDFQRVFVLARRAGVKEPWVDLVPAPEARP